MFNASALVFAQSLDLFKDPENPVVIASFDAFCFAYKEQEKLFQEMVELKNNLDDLPLDLSS